MPFPVLFASLLLLQSQPVVIPEQPVLTEVITASDTAIFSVMFDQCDPDALADLVTGDIEFYHDRGGLTATRAAFVDDYAKDCSGKQAADAFRSRRELVPGTLQVYPIPGIGAVEEGSHLFYERQGNGPEHLVGRARFSILWRLEDGHWRVARAFSIDHAEVE